MTATFSMRKMLAIAPLVRVCVCFSVTYIIAHRFTVVHAMMMMIMMMALVDHRRHKQF